MRCDNCGWDNADAATDCVKCKTPLQHAKTTPARFAGTILDASHHDASQRDASQRDQDQASQHHVGQDHEDQDKDTLIRCTTPGCGYENSSQARICPRCKQPLQPAAVTGAQTVAGGPAFQPTVAEKISPQATVAEKVPQATLADLPPRKPMAATIDPYRMKTGRPPVCYLKPVPREKEKLDNNGEAREFTYDDEPITLNRHNLEEKNNSITSKVQAELNCENGKWYLSDRSELHTTFIKVGEKMELKEGDTILMGDRKFIFTTSGDPLTP